MKIDKNTVLIVLIVAVLGFFLWKSRAAKKGQVYTEAVPQMPSVDKNRTSSIVSALGLSAAEREAVLGSANWAVYCKNNGTNSDWVKSIANSASDDGVTFEQEAVISALWGHFCGDKVVVKNPDAYERYRSMVLSM